MEGLQGCINPSLFGKEHLDLESSEKQRDTLLFSYGSFVNRDSFSFEEEEEQKQQQQPAEYLKNPLSLLEEDKMPFLQMLQDVGSFSPFTEPSFQVLLRLQHQKRPWGWSMPQMKPNTTNGTIESCVAREVVEMQNSPESKGYHHQHSSWPGLKSDYNQLEQPTYEDKCCIKRKSGNRPQRKARSESRLRVSPSVKRERRKRKRTRAVKNKEEAENQRMTHIAVERNRRRQMNDHLNALRSLMPSSYVQRGDQASIIGGAIEFVKELEQLLQFLLAQKRMRKTEEGRHGDTSSISTLSEPGRGGRKRSEQQLTADVQVMSVIQNHVNLKIGCDRRPGQLLKAIVALEDLNLTVLHLNITSLETSVHYSFNLKIEDDCKVGSADEIVAAVDQIFTTSSTPVS